MKSWLLTAGANLGPIWDQTSPLCLLEDFYLSHSQHKKQNSVIMARLHTYTTSPML